MTIQFPGLPEREQGQATPRETDPVIDTLLDAALGALPREHASETFTDQVLHRVERRQSLSQWRPLAAALALLAVGMGTYTWNERQERDAAVERVASMRAEYELLQEELARLEQAEQQRGLVYLGGKDDVEFVLDLGRLVKGSLEQRASPPSPSPATPGSAL